MTATRSAAAPARRAPARTPRPAKPNLRVVPPNTLSAVGRRRRARRFGVLLSSMVFIAVFGVVAAHVVLTQRQFRLQGMEDRAATEEARYERLRLEVAQLEAPERVVAAARELGMVPPANVTYVASSRTTPAASTDSRTPNEWARVKSHLAAAKP